MRTVILLFTLLGLACAAELPPNVFLQGARHEYQRFNNCGPVTIGMAMSFWGGRDTQYQIAPVLKPNKQDKNVGPEEMAAYARAQGFRAHHGVAGNTALLKRLIAAGFPVIVETWFVTPDSGGMGHYRLLVGYDDKKGIFNAFDSYYGPKVTLRYGDFDGLWQVFNRTYLVVYTAKQAPKIEAILGERLNSRALWRLSLELAREETQAQPSNAFAWFNLGTSLLRAGDAKGAARAFDRSRSLPLRRDYDPGRPGNAVSNWPWRMLWYQFTPLEAYHRTGRYQDVIALTSDVLGRVSDHEESYYWRAMARAALGKTQAAIGDLRAALRYKPGYSQAREALEKLQSQAGR
ncbi:C39 family peptidase [Calidithermus chliarophilus]|uniref:C39 family peptidase n=1 Tax=Calidithermus chliarophilus TaxID=52023 RepID=UPI00041C4DCD|nr:C39 family peptidase [Calidithermus chliarophilus]